MSLLCWDAMMIFIDSRGVHQLPVSCTLVFCITPLRLGSHDYWPTRVHDSKSVGKAAVNFTA